MTTSNAASTVSIINQKTMPEHGQYRQLVLQQQAYQSEVRQGEGRTDQGKMEEVRIRPTGKAGTVAAFATKS